jgi:5-hydroxyisourate hydrolase
MSGKITTHVLDLANSRPAGGMTVQLWRLAMNDSRILLSEVRMNRDGRPDVPLADANDLEPGVYELVFFVSDYYRDATGVPAEQAFLERVPVRFNLSEAKAHYHVPLLVSPGGYSTYRGS